MITPYFLSLNTTKTSKINHKQYPLVLNRDSNGVTQVTFFQFLKCLTTKTYGLIKPDNSASFQYLARALPNKLIFLWIWFFVKLSNVKNLHLSDLYDCEICLLDMHGIDPCYKRAPETPLTTSGLSQFSQKDITSCSISFSIYTVTIWLYMLR